MAHGQFVAVSVFVVMASPAGLHSAALSRAIFPPLRGEAPLFHSQFRRPLTSAGLFTSSSRRYKRVFQPVYAQARRSSPSIAKEAVASRKCKIRQSREMKYSILRLML